LNGKMHMGAHQAKCMYMVAKPPDSFLGKKIKPSPILIIIENVLPCVAPQDDVIQCPGLMDSRLPSHRPMLSEILQHCRPDPYQTPTMTPTTLPLATSQLDPQLLAPSAYLVLPLMQCLLAAPMSMKGTGHESGSPI
jgi:hypothetical protein